MTMDASPPAPAPEPFRPYVLRDRAGRIEVVWFDEQWRPKVISPELTLYVGATSGVVIGCQITDRREGGA